MACVQSGAWTNGNFSPFPHPTVDRRSCFNLSSETFDLWSIALFSWSSWYVVCLCFVCEKYVHPLTNLCPSQASFGNPTQIFGDDVIEEKGENARLSAFV